LENDVDQLIFKIIQLRTYARAKEQYDQGLQEQDLSKRPRGPMIDVVREITFEIAKEEIRRRRESEE